MDYIEILNYLFVFSLIYIFCEIIANTIKYYKYFRNIRVGDVYYHYEFPNAPIPVVITKKTKWKVYYTLSIMPLSGSNYKNEEYNNFFIWFILSSSKIK